MSDEMESGHSPKMDHDTIYREEAINYRFGKDQDDAETRSILKGIWIASIGSVVLGLALVFWLHNISITQDGNSEISLIEWIGKTLSFSDQ